MARQTGSEAVLRDMSDIRRQHAAISGAQVPMVRYRGVSKRFGEQIILHYVDFDVAPGERVSIIGPSGSGKTTLLRMLMTLERPTSGTIEVDGELLWHRRVKGQLRPADEKHLAGSAARSAWCFNSSTCFRT